ncbi:hypothetical protein FGO68_gene4156 [Halteria grandinella]|uniref:RING-type domain-containing protein n=1 Tax=Halteria grandinella TaxID=5974 RepID=A0A8J8NBW4_HALGN|nr:hypothetical protein FGO68_gene4156 [Halteria grandinella]
MQGSKGITECIICLTDFQQGETVIRLKCNEQHQFHEECLQGWVLNNFTCPLCREPILQAPAILQRIKTMNRLQASEYGAGDEENQLAEILANQRILTNRLGVARAQPGVLHPAFLY